MNRKISSVALTFVLVAVSLTAVNNLALGQTGTSVGGILENNTTWTAANSPYIVTSTVTVPENVTLTIEPGVVVKMEIRGWMFLVHGVIIAHGTPDSKIVFDGGYLASFFTAEYASGDAFVDLEYCVIKNNMNARTGGSFWYSVHGHFSLRNSVLLNLRGCSYISYPVKDILIEQNIFVNSAGFSTETHDGNVIIKNNLFIGKNPGCPFYVVENMISYNSSKTIVKFNSFLDMNGTVLALTLGSGAHAIIATENYWGTTNTSEIDSMIYDKNDDRTLAGFIEYLPILTEPHAGTPTLPKPTLEVSCKSTTSYPNFNVKIKGSLTLNGTAIPDAPVLLYYSRDDGRLYYLGMENTDLNGTYSAMLTPPPTPYVTGIYLIKAVYEGDENYLGTTRIVNMAVAQFEETNVFSVASNSTVSSLIFDSENKELNFTLSGDSGTSGYADVYIAKSLVHDASRIEVYLDESKLDHTVTSIDDSWLLHFTYSHSIHSVTIILEASAGLGNWMFFAFAAVVVIIVVALLVLRIRKAKVG